MDESLDPAEENVNIVLAQESSRLSSVLSSHSPTVIRKLFNMVPRSTRQEIGCHAVASTLPAAAAVAAQSIKDMLEYFSATNAAECCCFVQHMCMLCEFPLDLESRLMSAAGHENRVDENICPSVTDKELSPSHSETQLVKRPRIDHWEQFVAATKHVLQRRWERLSESLVNKVQLENVWVNLKLTARGKDRPDQTPWQTERGSRTPDGDFSLLESRVTLENFLQGCVGKVTVLSGQAGSGRTLLMSYLGHLWECSLGPIPSSYLFVLLEFRQLKFLSQPVSLSELLFRCTPSPNRVDDEKRAIVEYLLSNPEQSCWVLDGYDECDCRLTGQWEQRESLDPDISLPVQELISALLHRQLLPGCTVLITCRGRDVTDLERVSDKVGQLRGWDWHEIKDYVDSFFGLQADKTLSAQAANLLISSRHILAMSCLPALCNVCCIYLRQLLLEVNEGGTLEQQEGGGCETRREVVPPPSQDHIPSTLTQVYLSVLCAFVSCDAKDGRISKGKTTKPPQRAICSLNALSQYGNKFCELSQLAWSGFQEGKIIFLKEDIPPSILDFSIRIGLLSQMELILENGMLANAYRFIHVTIQEFLAALRIMSSIAVSDAELKKSLSLRTRWISRSDQRTVFTDSLHLFLCGLASQHCTSVLVALARASGQTGAQKWVKNRQTTVLNLLKNMCQNSTLTGPKILQLCHCVQESQEQQLAEVAVGARSTLELRNIHLLPKDIDALAFVLKSVSDRGFGLNFGACSIELECLEDLPKCQNIHKLSFHSRKYGDKFAEKLASILPEFTTLKKLEFCGTSVTASGAATLAFALEKCPHITHINFSDNNLKDEGIKHIVDVLPKLPRLLSAKVGRNNSSLKTVDSLIKTMSTCLSIQRVEANSTQEIEVVLSQTSGLDRSEATISLWNQKWSKPEIQTVAHSLTHCRTLSVLDLSGGQWDVETLKTLTAFMPKFNVTNKIILNNSCSSVEDLVVLTALLSNHPAVMELHVRLQTNDANPAPVSVVFSGGSQKPANTKTLSLSCCGLQQRDLTRVWRTLGKTCDLTVLDLSSNRLGYNGLEKFLNFLPRLPNIKEINITDNGVGMEGVLLLADVLCFHNNLTQVHISDDGRKQLILNFCSDQSDDKQQPRSFRLNNSSLSPSDITTLCKTLFQCDSALEFDISNSITSTTEALILLSCLTDNQRVTSVELGPDGECFIHMDKVKAEYTRCRFTHFNLTGENMQRLVEILQLCPRLSDLDLSSNQLKDEGVKCLTDSLHKLKINNFVNLSNNCLTEQGLLHVAGSLCTCDDVSAVEVSLGVEERCLIFLREFGSSEKTLSVRDSHLERQHLLRLAEIVTDCPRLSNLEFKNNSLQSEWIEDFLSVLNIGSNGCNVSFNECWIGADKAVDLLRRCLELCSNIHTIRVHHTTLQLSLIKAPGLTSDSLVDGEVEGRQLSPMKTMIPRCSSLTELHLSLSSFRTEGLKCLCSILPSLPKLTSLSVVSKETCKTVVDKLSEALLQVTTLQCLNLSGHVISDTAAHTMTRIMPQLRTLSLSDCPWSTAAGLQLVKALGQCVRLEHLCLDSVQLDENCKTSLAQALQKFKHICSLRVNMTDAVTEPSAENMDLLAALEGQTLFEEIELDGWRMSDGGVEQLTTLLPLWTHLRKISLSKNLISDQSGDRLLEALHSCRHLEELCLSRNHLGDLTAARMALRLPALTHITILDISENTFGSGGSVNLSKAIRSLKNLKKLHLTSVGTPELSAVAASLSHCPLIQDVGFGWNNCDDNVVLELARVLPSCQKLTRIDLEANSVSVIGVNSLLKPLRLCPSLQLIRLWRNKVSSAEAQQLTVKDRRLNFSSTLT